MKFIAASILVLASAWFWNTTATLMVVPRNTDFAVTIGVLLTFATLIVGLRTFLAKDSTSPRDSSPLPPAALPPQNVSPPDTPLHS